MQMAIDWFRSVAGTMKYVADGKAVDERINRMRHHRLTQLTRCDRSMKHGIDIRLALEIIHRRRIQCVVVRSVDNSLRCYSCFFRTIMFL